MADALTEADFRRISLVPPAWVERVQTQLFPSEPGQPSWVLEQCRLKQAWVYSRLDLNYDVQKFGDPVPAIIKQWIAYLVAADLLMLLGDEPNQEDIDRYEKRADQSRADIEAAANSETGLFSLPLKQGTSTDGAQRKTVRYTHTASPYVSLRMQRDRGRAEDESGTGTRG